MLWGVAERLPQLVYGSIQPVLEIDKGVRAPEILTQFLARHYFSGPLGQNGQDADRIATEA